MMRNRLRPGSRVPAAIALLLVGVLTNAPAAEDVDICATCHVGYADTLAHTKHGFAEDTRTPFGAGQACVACHGDASRHLEDPTSAFPDVRFGPQHDLTVQNDKCLSCHQGGHLMHWQGSLHEAAGVPCASCHNPHAPAQQALIGQLQAGVCFDCHTNVRSDMMRSSTHPIRSGAMSCSACHNPHGSVADHALVRSTINETCYDCHAEKRGPFLWEHPPAREDCMNCHSPHGSNTAPMLVARGPFLCQQCHLNPFHPSTAYSGNNLPPNVGADKMLGNNCMNCHSKVHGSNHPSGARLTR